MTEYDELVEKHRHAQRTYDLFSKEYERIGVELSRAELRLKGIEEKIKHEMMTDGCIEQDVGDVCLKLRKRPARLEIYNNDAVPDEFMREKVVRSPDKVAIKKWLDEGNATNFARLIDDDYNLQVKFI